SLKELLEQQQIACGLPAASADAAAQDAAAEPTMRRARARSFGVGRRRPRSAGPPGRPYIGSAKGPAGGERPAPSASGAGGVVPTRAVADRQEQLAERRHRRTMERRLKLARFLEEELASGPLSTQKEGRPPASMLERRLVRAPSVASRRE
ncbi:unnamed protein product, partial [Prorocentrum cordatum]